MYPIRDLLMKTNYLIITDKTFLLFYNFFQRIILIL